MRIAMVTPVPGSAGGMGRVVEEYARRIAARGHEVTVFAPGSHPETKPLLRFGNAAWLPRLAKVLDGFDIVHVHYPCIGSARAVRRWRKRTKNGKLVITYHLDLIGRGLTRPVFAIYSWFTTPRILRAADQIITASLDYLEHSNFAGIFRERRERTIEIPFGVDTERFAPREQDQALLVQLGLEREESVVLFVGKLDSAHYFKGVATLLKAFALLQKEAHRIRLLIVGGGDRKKHYEQLAKRLLKKYGHPELDQPTEGLSEGSRTPIIFAGTVSPADLPKYYALADVLVLPSQTRSEAFGLVLLEAQASGVPVIASNLPGVRTVVEDGKTGLLVTPAQPLELTQAIARVLTRPDDRKRMAEAARVRTVASYRWDIVIDRLEALYRSLV